MDKVYLNIPPLTNDNIAKSIVSVIHNKGIQLDYLNGIVLLSELEQMLFGLVTNYGGTADERQQIFHLIQIWGGPTGRHIYTPKKLPFNWNIIDEHYSTFIYNVSLITGCSVNDFIQARNACYDFKQSVGNIGISYSFITKHLRFWSFPNLRANLFPPYDSKAATQYMQHIRYNERDMVPYWQRIYREANEQGLPVSIYERNLFNTFQ